MFSLLQCHSQKYSFISSLPALSEMLSTPRFDLHGQKWTIVHLLGFNPESSSMTKCVCKEGNPNLAGVREWINKIKRCGVRTFISDGLGVTELVLHAVFHQAWVSCSQVPCVVNSEWFWHEVRRQLVFWGQTPSCPVLSGLQSDTEPGEGVKVLTTLKLET